MYILYHFFNTDFTAQREIRFSGVTERAKYRKNLPLGIDVLFQVLVLGVELKCKLYLTLIDREMQGEACV